MTINFTTNNLQTNIIINIIDILIPRQQHNK